MVDKTSSIFQGHRVLLMSIDESIEAFRIDVN
jgi:hypothetical protein